MVCKTLAVYVLQPLADATFNSIQTVRGHMWLQEMRPKTYGGDSVLLELARRAVTVNRSMNIWIPAALNLVMMSVPGLGWYPVECGCFYVYQA